MTIKELMSELVTLMDMGIDPDTLVVVCDPDFDPDPDVFCSFYCEERDRVCLTII